MCQFHTWFHNVETGYVIECLHCKKIQVSFGNISASFHYEQFDQLRAYVGYVWELNPLKILEINTNSFLNLQKQNPEYDFFKN